MLAPGVENLLVAEADAAAPMAGFPGMSSNAENSRFSMSASKPCLPVPGRWLLFRRLMVTSMVAGIAAGCGGGDDPREVLRSAATLSTGPYRFEDRADSPGLQACVNGLDPVDGIVDPLARVMVVGRPGGQSPLGVVVEQAVFVRSAMLVSDEQSAAWVQVPGDVSEELRMPLERLLGPVLARYMLTGGLPSGPDELATSAAEHGVRFSASTVDGTTRVEVGFGDSVETESGEPDLTGVRLSFDIDADGRITMVHATTAEADLDDLGFRVTFDWPESLKVKVPPGIEAAVLLDDSTDLRDAPADNCSIGVVSTDAAGS